MDPIYHGDNEQKSFFQTIEKFTDRELQEKQAQYLWSIDKNTKRIKNARADRGSAVRPSRTRPIVNPNSKIVNSQGGYSSNW